jgi:hypothetical protein
MARIDCKADDTDERHQGNQHQQHDATPISM